MTMDINGRKIGPYHTPYVIAELSANHNGSLERVYDLISAAKAAGADAVKIQSYTPDTITLNSSRPEFVIQDGPWKGRRLYDLYKEAHTPFEWHPAIFEFAAKVGITIFSSVFDETSVDMLEKLGCPAYKIASFEMTDSMLVKYVAMTQKPVIMSTGMASLAEIRRATSVFRKNSVKEDDLVLMHCVSAYPASPSEANLPFLGPLSDVFPGQKVGLSDHTLGSGVAAAAVAFGACVIEKHLTLRRADGGPDAAFSLEPVEFERLVVAVRDAYAATRPSSSPSQEPNRQFRRSIYVVAPVKRGCSLSKEHLRVVRPALGLPAAAYERVLGAVATQDLEAGTPLFPEQVGLSSISSDED